LRSRVAVWAALMCSGVSISGTALSSTSAGPTLVPALPFAREEGVALLQSQGVADDAHRIVESKVRQALRPQIAKGRHGVPEAEEMDATGSAEDRPEFLDDRGRLRVGAVQVERVGNEILELGLQEVAPAQEAREGAHGEGPPG
jgi:hypothetical protein